MFNKAICNELTKAKRLANLIEEVGDHLAILFEQDNLEMEHFELSEGQTGWVYAIKLKDNDVDFSGVVDYGTCVERLILNIYEDVWNSEILPEPEMEDYTNEQLFEKIKDLEALRIELLVNEALLSKLLSNTETTTSRQNTETTTSRQNTETEEANYTKEQLLEKIEELEECISNMCSVMCYIREISRRILANNDRNRIFGEPLMPHPELIEKIEIIYNNTSKILRKRYFKENK